MGLSRAFPRPQQLVSRPKLSRQARARLIFDLLNEPAVEWMLRRGHPFHRVDWFITLDNEDHQVQIGKVLNEQRQSEPVPAK